MSEYQYYNDLRDLRRRLRNLPFEDKVAALEELYPEERVHGYFDAVGPEINDRYRWDEIVSWLIRAGFEDIKRTVYPNPNHHVVARKKVR